jgi:hypothetical protein
MMPHALTGAHTDPHARRPQSQDELNTTARFTHLKKGPSDADLAAFSALGAKFDNAYLGTYRFNKARASMPARRSPYAITSVYAVGDWVEHKTLGPGLVLALVEQTKVRILFEKGARVPLHRG